MSAGAEVEERVEALLGQAPRAVRSLGGGSLSSAWRVELADGTVAFAKGRGGAARGELELEAAGLRWLAGAGEVNVPRVLAVDDPHLLVLEWIESEAGATAAGADHERLGRELAALHSAGAAAHGSLPPGSPAGPLRIGPLELPAVERESWAAVYREDRLEPLARMAFDRRGLSGEGQRAVEAVAERIEGLAGPCEAPARLHGDLWSGNVVFGASGAPWLIDPAAHGGHREIDLAMSRLFGSPPARFFDAYDERNPLAPGHEERVPLWQIMPLLVHAVLFGGSYGAAAERAARHYL